MTRLAATLALLATAVSVSAVRADGEEEAPASSFMRSRSSEGLTAFETATRVYRRPDGTGPVVSLVGVVHIGDLGYYEELVGILERSEIVLYESVLPRGAFGTRGRNDSERQRRTQDALLFLRSLAEGFERANGRAATSLAELRAFTVSRDTRLARPFDLACVDGWGRRIGYSAAGGGYAFVSLGADGAAGGSDAALDLVLPRIRRDAPAATDGNGARKGDERRDLYKEFADALGVSLQVRSINYDRAGWEPADLPMEELLDRLWQRGERSATLEMLSRQDGLAQGLLRFFLSIVSESPQFKKTVIQALGSAGATDGRRGARRGAGLGPVDERIIIDERNDAVVDELSHLLAQPAPPSSVAIFYGAAHMGDFESTLRARWGLEPAEVVWSSAMSVDEWSDKKVSERIKSLEASAESIRNSDPQGCYPSCARIESRIKALRARIDAPPKP
jgi:hypothetical protein